MTNTNNPKENLMTRYALRWISADKDPIAEAAKVERYMPSNYAAYPVLDANDRPAVLIVGEDVAGWTLDGYTLPRLASGLLAAREITDTEARGCTRVGAA